MEVSEVVKLLSSKVPDVDEICSEILKALAIVWLSWLTCIFSVMGRDSACVLVDRVGGSHF